MAEVAVGFAGFASIVTVLGRRRYPQSLQDSLRLRIMLVYSVMVVFLSILPEILNGYGFPTGTVWRASCAIFALLASGIFVGLIAGPGPTVFRAIRYNRAYMAFFFTLQLAPALACGLVALGLGAHFAPATYMASLASLLLAAAVVFVRLVLSLLEQSEPPAA